MVSTPWLSVLMPVFDIEPWLAAGVDALMAQADDGVELLLLDDGSRDGSPALMQALARRWGPRVRCLAHPANRGLAAARNSLLDAARGEHVWFVDGDDEVAPGVLPRLRERLAGGGGPDLLFFDYAVRRDRPRPHHRWRGEHHRPGFAGPSRVALSGAEAVFTGWLTTGNLFVWTHVARRAIWAADLRFPEGRAFEDMATMPRMVLRAASAWHEPEPWIFYRRRAGSISAVMSAPRVADLSAALRGARDELQRRLPEAGEAARFALAHQAARNLLAAQRHAARLASDERRALWPRLHEDFAAAAGADLALLWRGYLARGWLWRAWRLRRALARCAP